MRISADNIERIRRYAANGRVVVFDTETTGCSRWDEICQIAAVEYVGGVRARTFSVYVCPTCEINPWAEGVHGLSMDFLSEHGWTPEEAMRQFFEFLGDDVLLVAHNSRFDMRMLDSECRKFGLCFSPEGLETCDTLALAKRLRPGLERMLCPRVHFKCIIVDGRTAYFGSANLTGAGMSAKSERTRNFENGVLSDYPALVAPLVEQFDSVWRGDFCRDCGRRDFCGDCPVDDFGA